MDFREDGPLAPILTLGSGSALAGSDGLAVTR
jgi:hypothetical protein